MKTTTFYQLVEGLQHWAWSIDQERHKKWIKLSFDMSGGDSHLMSSLQEIGKLDAVLIALERECVSYLKSPETHRGDGLDFQLVLSDAWLAIAYEAVRLIQERTPSEQARATKIEFAKVRMPLFKGQTRGRDPINHRPKRDVDRDTGSVVWNVQTSNGGKETAISRLGLSDSMLALI